MMDARLNTAEKERFLSSRTYRETQSNVSIASEKIQTIMGYEAEPSDDHGRLLIAPWHMPLPKELHRQLPKSLPGQLARRKSSTTAGPESQEFPIIRASSDPPVRMSKRKTEPSNQLERSLHNKHLAQNLSSSATALPIPLWTREVNLPILTRFNNVGKVPTVTENTKLKRKLSKLSIPSDSKDKSPTRFVPNLAMQPDFGPQLLTSEPTFDCDQSDVFNHPESSEHNGDVSESPSPPRRRVMPPIAAILAHGFRNINLDPPFEPITPRSHAFDPWTRLRFEHKVLSPTPAFLLSLSAFKYDDSEESSSWRSSLPVIISYHLANPATLVHETSIQDITMCLPIPKPSIIIDTRDRRRAPPRARLPHYQCEGPMTNTEIRLIRMILPPALPNVFYQQRSQQAPFTDWLILCLSSPTPRLVKPHHNTRASTQAQQQPYLIIAIPTQAIRKTELVVKSPVMSPVDQQQQQMSTTIMLEFGARGRMPLMFGVKRECAFAKRWVQGFAHGKSALEVTYLGSEAPCWL